MTISKVAPALLAGRSVVLNPTSETPFDGLGPGKCSGVPEGAVSTVPGAAVRIHTI